MNNKPLVGVAAHSGGHIIPVLTVLQQSNSAWHLITSNALLEQKIITGYDIAPSQQTMYTLRAIAWRRPWRWLQSIWQLSYICVHSFRVLRKLQPRAVISSGGLLAIPVSYAAWLCQIPVELWILDAVPGNAARAIMPIADIIHVVMPAAEKYCPTHKIKKSAYPIRKELQHLPAQAQARQMLGLELDKPTLIVLGGSQGSRQLNELVITALATNNMLCQHYQIFHQAGPEAAYVTQRYQQLNISAQVVEYTNNMPLVYAAASIAIARAGAGTIAELYAAHVPTILIPLIAKTTSHQVDNARAVAAQHPEHFTWADPATLTSLQVCIYLQNHLIG